MRRGRARAMIGRAIGFGVLLLAAAPSPEAGHLDGAPIAARGGETTSLLPDGRWLILGGEAGGHAVADAIVRDPATGATAVLRTHLRHPRAWHSATVLPDGGVLVLGGVGPRGGLVRQAERFDPVTQVFTPVPVHVPPRTAHTATVLTDGRLLVAGGVGADGQPIAAALLIDLGRPGWTRPSGALHAARYSHVATLLADGRVLVWGGLDEHGRPRTDGEEFAPAVEAFSTVDSPPPPSEWPALAASLPADGAEGVPLARPLAARFALPLDVRTSTSGSISLSGMAGPVATRIVAAEGGRLLFVTPVSPLAPGTAYTLALAGLADERGHAVPPASVHFTTGGRPSDATSSEARNSATPPGAGTSAASVPALRSDAGTQPAEAAAPITPRGPHRVKPEALPPLDAPPGVTALAGQVLRLDGRPLVGASLELDGVTTRADATGRFLLAGIGTGRRVFVLDGRGVSTPGHTYGVFEIGVDVVGGQTNALPFTLWMPEIDTTHEVTIPSPTPGEVVIRTPRIPGLELHLPAGTVVRDREGNVVTHISITPFSRKRPIMPLPPEMKPPVFVTIQPGGAHVEAPNGAGASFVYPNPTHLRPGKRVPFMTYDPFGKDMYVYGLGRVSPDGRRIVPDQGTTFDRFRCTLNNPGDSPPDEAPTPCDGTDPANECDGDPVDLSTGLYSYSRTDLAIDDVIPIAVTRMYQTEDRAMYTFGVGMQHTYAMYLFSAHQFTEANLILPDGGKVHYDRISSGDGYQDAVFENTDSTTVYRKSRVTWNGRGWDLTLRNGTVYVFGTSAHLNAIRDRNGNQVTIARAQGTFGAITRVTSPSGRSIDFTYNPAGVITQVHDNIGRAVTYQYDGGGHLAQVTDANGGVTTYTYYSTDGRLKQIHDPRANAPGSNFPGPYVTNTYDPAGNGRVQQQARLDGKIYQFAYTLDANGRVVQTESTDPLGLVRRLTFGPTDAVLSDTRAVGQPEQQTITYVREAGTNLVLSTTDPLGRRTDFTYDALGMVTSITRLAGTPGAVTSSFTYEPTLELVHTRTDPLGHTTTYVHDTRGNVLQIVDPLGHTATRQYNEMGRPITSADPFGNTFRYSYDLGDLIAVTDPLGNTAKLFRDGGGRLVAKTDPLGRTTRSQLDPLDRQTQVTDALGFTSQEAFDPNSNPMSATDPRGNATNFTADKLDRLAVRTNALGLKDTYTYNADGNVIAFKDRSGKTTTASYDHLNRRTSLGFDAVVDAGGNTTYESQIFYTYDAGNRLIRVDDVRYGASPTTYSITRTYDDLDRLTAETTLVGTVSYGYDAAGRRTRLSVSGQADVLYTYDAADRLTGTNGVTFAYDNADRRTNVTLPNNVLVEYGYDAAGRVTGIVYFGASFLQDLIYTYDAVGNRVGTEGSWARVALPPSAAATNNAANALTSWNASALTYDANGNLKTDAVHNFTYFWNARNELVEITNPGTLAKFTYDPFGRRISKEVIGRATVYLYDGNTVVRETGDVGTASTLSGLGTDEYLSRTVNGVVSYFLPDAIRSTVALTDANGTVTTQYTYEPFGATFVAGPPRANPFRFAGREDDGETDLYYYRARYYSPHFQRFISEDPLAHRPLFVSVPPAYRYALNNPLSLIDPDGLACYRAPPGVDPNELQYGLMGLGVGAIAGAVIGIVEEMVATAAALEEAPGGGMAPQLPSQDYPPGPGFEWRGDPEKGSWFNPDTGEYVRPDWNHDPSIPPHVDYRGPDGTEWRVFPNGPGGPPGGRWEPK